MNDIDDVEKVMPGKLKEVFEFLRDYKIPDGKPANKFAFNDEVKDKAFAMGIIKETYDEWRKLVDGKVDAKGVSITNAKLEGTSGFTSSADAKSKIQG
jgi:Inorganic pyrophosphatase